MSTLNSITIENIKGIDQKNFLLDLIPNKPCILVAPNGFGKSSIACALNSLNKSKIKLHDKYRHCGDLNKQATITIKIDDVDYSASETSNNIFDAVDIYVINNTVFAKASSRNINGYNAPRASLEIESVTLVDTIPKTSRFEYAIREAKNGFGNSGKILPDISSLLTNFEFIYQFHHQIDISEFEKNRTFITPFNRIKEQINQQSGTSEYIKTWISNNLISNLEVVVPLKKLADLINKINPSQNKIDAYLYAFQFIELIKKKSSKLAIKYNLYLREKDYYNKILSSFDTTRHAIKAKEHKGSLIVTFPKVDDISNGQRDILNFITQINQARKKLCSNNCILVIDEIFDYLDDANLISFQYFIVNFIEDFKKQNRKIYPILLTHLDPSFFNHLCFSKHRIQVRYLASDPNAKSELLRLVKHREEPSIKDDVDKYHFHYHPESIDLEIKFQALDLKKFWGNSNNFYLYLEKEKNKYQQGSPYDAIAVMLAVRRQIELLAYQKLSVALQCNFLQTHGTKKKLEYCMDHGVEIPEVHFLLGIIYNDQLHWRENWDFDTPLRSKLNNITIKKLISDLFSP